MKIILIVFCTSLFSLTAKAQQKNIFKNKSWEDAGLKRLLHDTLYKANPLLNNSVPMQNKDKMGVLQLPIQGHYLRNNENGDEIYAMTPDNMPCLVPGKDIRHNMPVAGIVEKYKNPFPLLKKDKKETVPEK